MNFFKVNDHRLKAGEGTDPLYAGSKNTWKFCMIFNKSCAGRRDDPVIKWKLPGGGETITHGCPEGIVMPVK